MHLISRRQTLLALLAIPLISAKPAPARAAPVAYKLDTRASTVRFTFSISGLMQTGTMPIRSAQISVDPQHLQNSRFRVELDAAQASTPLDIATRAMTGPEVLDTAAFPRITFATTSVQLGANNRLSQGATIRGDLTLRGRTHPVQLNAELYRPPGSAPDDLSTLSARLSGQVSRSRFGATGYGDLVADAVGLDIVAVVHAAS